MDGGNGLEADWNRLEADWNVLEATA